MPTLLPAALLALGVLLPTEPETVEAIEIYGLRRLEPEPIHAVLGFEVGSSADFDRAAAVERLRALPGVDDAKIVTAAAAGSTRVSVLVGVLETGSPRPVTRPAPTGEVRLPEGYVATYDAIHATELEGFLEGVGGSDESAGHPLSKYPPTRALQEELLARVGDDLPRLRRVLGESADVTHRRVAAHALGYAPDKQAVIDDLAFAMTDPDPGVRNNAVRALGVLLRWSQAGDRGLVFDFDPSPLVVLLDSVAWTDRNKAAAILDALSAERDPELFALLREQALPALAEMAGWRSEGHALFSVRILARLAGRDEAEVRALGARLADEGLAARRAWVARTVEGLRAGA